MCPSFLVPGLLQNSRRPGRRTEVYLPESPCLLLFEQSGKRWSVGIGLIWIPVPSLSTLDSLLHWFCFLCSWNDTYIVEWSVIKTDVFCTWHPSSLTRAFSFVCLHLHILVDCLCLLSAECDSPLQPLQCISHSRFLPMFFAWLVCPGKAVAK